MESVICSHSLCKSLLFFSRLLWVCQSVSLQKTKNRPCNWYYSFYATKSACNTRRDKCPINSSSKSSQVFFLFFFVFLPPAYNTQDTSNWDKSFLFLYRRPTRQTKSGSLSARPRWTFIPVARFPFTYTSSWSHDHISNNADVVFYFGRFPERGLLGQKYPRRSSQTGRLPSVSLDASSINSSLSDDSRSLSLADRVVSKAGWRSFKWRGVPLTDTDCSLTMSVTRNFLKLEVNRLLGGFTLIWSPLLYELRISLQPSGHTPSIPLIWTR